MTAYLLGKRLDNNVILDIINFIKSSVYLIARYLVIKFQFVLALSNFVLVVTIVTHIK